MEGRPKRLLTVTVRGAADLPKPVSKPFVVVELAGTTVGSTDVAQAAGANPVREGRGTRREKRGSARRSPPLATARLGRR